MVPAQGTSQHRHVRQSAVITLGAHGKQAFRGNAVRKAVFRADELFAFQLFEDLRVAVAEQPTLAGIAFHIGHFAGIIADYQDSTTLGEGMESSLPQNGKCSREYPLQWIIDKTPHKGG